MTARTVQPDPESAAALARARLLRSQAFRAMFLNLMAERSYSAAS